MQDIYFLLTLLHVGKRSNVWLCSKSCWRIYKLSEWSIFFYILSSNKNLTTPPCPSVSRCSHLDGDPREVSPVIDQFFDCVWQLMEQFPCAFEFNERFLVHIHHHVYSCQFGDFICNNNKESKELR